MFCSLLYTSPAEAFTRLPRRKWAQSFHLCHATAQAGVNMKWLAIGFEYLNVPGPYN